MWFLHRARRDADQHAEPHREDAERGRTITATNTGSAAKKAMVVDHRRSRKSLAPMRIPSVTKVTAAGQLHDPEHDQSDCRRVDHAGIVGEDPRQHRRHGEGHDGEQDPGPPRPAVEVVDDVARLVGPARAQGVPDQRLARHLEHVDGDGEQQEHLRGDLVAGQLGGADPCRRRRGHGQRGQQEAGALHQVGADLDHLPHHRRHDGEVVEPVGAQARDDDGEEHDGAEDLGGDRAPRAPGDPPVEPEHEHQLEDEVGRGRRTAARRTAAWCRAGRTGSRCTRSRPSGTGCRPR